MEVTKRFVYRDKNNWAGPIFGPVTVISLVSAPFLGWWVLAFTAVGALGLWKLVDWGSEKTIDSIKRENIDDAQVSGYGVLLRGFGTSEVAFLNCDRDLIFRQMVEDFWNRHWIIETKCHARDIRALRIRTKPDKLAVNAGLGKFTIAGTLMYGATGLIVGSIIDSLKGPKKVDFELDIEFEFIGGESLTIKAFRSAFGVTDDNRHEFQQFVEEEVVPRMQKTMAIVAETFPDLARD